MSSPVSLLDMPDLPLKHIISYIGFRSLQSLRLVSKPLCHFIDTKKPSVQIDEFCIKPAKHCVELKLISCGQNFQLEIQNHGARSFVKSSSRSGYYVDTYYLDYSVNLIENVFNTQTKQTIKKLQYSEIEVKVNRKLEYSEIFVNSEFLKLFQKLLSDRKIILRVRELCFDGEEHQAVQFLRFFDSNILKSLIFRMSPVITSSHDLMQLEQWKKAKCLVSTGLKAFRVPIQSFVHFETANFYTFQITAEDLVYLKERYSQYPHSTKATVHYQGTDSPFEVLGEPIEANSSYFKQAIIHVFDLIDSASMVPVLGEPFKVYGDDREWYFKCSDSGSALYLYMTRRLVKFVRCPISAVPKECRMRG